jgi:hypothetical protein
MAIIRKAVFSPRIWTPSFGKGHDTQSYDYGTKCGGSLFPPVLSRQTS